MIAASSVSAAPLAPAPDLARLARLAARLLHAPLALLVLDRAYGWWRHPALPLDPAPLCAALVARPPRPPRRPCPLPRLAPQLRTCFAWPIPGPARRPLGVLYVLHRRPRRLTPADRHACAVLLPLLADALLLRRLRAALPALRRRIRRQERRRFAFELHDGPAQTLASLARRLQALAHARCPPADRRSRLQSLVRLARHALDETRRLLADRPPAALDGRRLASAVQALVAPLRAAGWTVAVTVRLGPRPLPPPVERTLYRVAQQALANAAQHAQTRRAALTLIRAADEVRLTVRDWGRGFAVPTRVACGRGLGLRTMRTRLAQLGGTLEVRSRPGAGTTVIARLPTLPEGWSGGRQWRRAQVPRSCGC